MPHTTSARRALARCLSAALAATLVLAAFALGAAPASAFASGSGVIAPGEPSNVVVTDYNNEIVDVSWDAPATGDPTTLYSVKVQEWDSGDYVSDGYFRERNADPADWSRSWSFDDVPFGLVFKVEVYESNEGGDGPVFVSDVLTKEASTAPSAPRNVTATSATPNAVTVTWDAPASDGGKPLAGYAVQVQDGNDADYVIVELTDPRTATFTGIAAGTYDVSVLAGSPNGPGPAATTQVTVANPVAANPVAATPATPTPTTQTSTPVLAKPGAPVRLKATPVKTGGVTTITWRAPRRVTGAPVLRYVLHVDGRRLVVAKGTSLKVAGLRKGPAQVVARAVNKVGTSSSATRMLRVTSRVAHAHMPALRLGDHGAAVRRLQKALRTEVTGWFDKTTLDAVVMWQTAFHLHHRHPFGASKARLATDRMRYLLGV